MKMEFVRINENLNKKYFQAIQSLEGYNASSEHEMTIKRAILSSSSIVEAARKIYKMKGGRLNNITKQDAVDMVENIIKLGER